MQESVGASAREQGGLKAPLLRDEESYAASDLEKPAHHLHEPTGKWYNGAFALFLGITSFAVLILPSNFSSLGWAGGLVSLGVTWALAAYAALLLSELQSAPAVGGGPAPPHLRYRDLGMAILGPKWGWWTTVPFQILGVLPFCMGRGIIVGQSMKAIYLLYSANPGAVQLWGFIAIYGAGMILMALLPDMHSLRHLTQGTAIICVGFVAIAIGLASVDGARNVEPVDYGIYGSTAGKLFAVFYQISLMGSNFAAIAVLPEIQATLAQPAVPKTKAATMAAWSAFAVLALPVAVTGYWAYGAGAGAIIMLDWTPDRQPRWVIALCWLLVGVQSFVSGRMYIQPVFEFLDRSVSDLAAPPAALRNVAPRLAARWAYVAISTILAAMLPFFNDVLALTAAIGFMPLELVMPFVLYDTAKKTKGLRRIFHGVVATVYALLCALGGIAAARQIILNASTFKLFADI